MLLQMPGVQDPERVKDILKGESRLELVHVIGPPSPPPTSTYLTEAEAIAIARRDRSAESQGAAVQRTDRAERIIPTRTSRDRGSG